MLNDTLRARVERVVRLTPTIVEVVVHAPAAARAVSRRASSIACRISSRSPRVRSGTRLAMEGLALTGAWVDRERGLVSMIVLEMGGSSDLCAALAAGRAGRADGTDRNADRDRARRDRRAGRRRPRQRGAVLDRPRVSRTRARKCSISPATGACVDRYKVDDIEAAADAVVWCCDEGPGFAPTRPQDRAFVGNIVEAMRAYASGRARRAADSASTHATASSPSAPTG